ncbi:MAG: GGDEF domain-containing protein [Thiotrichales bacterium]|nr:GGDEF domain-containing protein [Thiotrichales bacterium]
MLEKQDVSGGFRTYSFEDIYSKENNALLESGQDIFSTLIPEATDFFYQNLMENPEAAKFLSTELVQSRLKNDLKAWLKQLLSPKVDLGEIGRVVETQYHVGEVHARINIPMSLVSTSMFFIKHKFIAAIYGSDNFSSDDKLLLIMLLDTLMVNSLNLINEAYLHNLVQHKRAAIDYQYHTSPKDTALEIVQIKSKLYNWLADYLGYITSATPGIEFPVTEANECGLWITHKLPFIAKKMESVDQIQQLQQNLRQVIKERGVGDLPVHGNKVRNLVKEITFLLTNISEQILKESEQQDGLTGLISRRYLAPIIQSETQTAMTAKTSYSVVMFDIDDFKKINDEYGHLTGDKVILEVGKAAREEIQLSDYAFRYGGEEFLLLLPECGLSKGVSTAEKIREKISKTPIDVGEKAPLFVTCSFGVSEFSNHPDYMTVIKEADEKLYESKREGKNQTRF